MNIERTLNEKFNLLRQNKEVIKARSKYFGEIGSTSAEDIPYKKQLDAKKEIIKTIFSEDLAVTNELIQTVEIIPSPKTYEYRFKMDFVCAFNPIHEPYTRMGQRKRGTFNWVVDMNECVLIDEIWFKKIRKIYEITQKLGIQNYDLKKNTGDLRYLVSKIYKNEAMLTFVTRDETVKEIITKAAELALKLGFKSVYWQVQPRTTDLSKGENQEFWGAASITIDLDTNAGKFYFKVGPNTFFQNNIYAFQEILNYIFTGFENKNAILFDLYCGTGTISIPLASKFKKIIGIDIEEDSIKNAKENAKLNSVNNAEFYAMDITAPGSPLYKEYDDEVIAIIDPPRTGVGKNGIQVLLTLNPSKIIYISCNPETQVKDLKDLVELYEIKSIKAFDMFPHTNHIENVVVLQRK